MGKISCLEQNLIDITDYYEEELAKYENASESEQRKSRSHSRMQQMSNIEEEKHSEKEDSDDYVSNDNDKTEELIQMDDIEVLSMSAEVNEDERNSERRY